ncbi:trigger factor [uncultured Campylobacter sp.]|uniref:trigger factor n=1 Tax=uncultured Campylobacter sp. TaxID=218934 RepID=UPI0026150CA0|nr:trigger factor [uncultured Campylobacter sp.]
MEVKAKMKDAANAVAASKIEAKQIAAKVEELAKKASKQLRIDGFRQGKVPTAVVLKRYGKQLEGDAKQELLKNMIDQSLKILKKKQDEILSEPVFSKFDEKEGDIDVEIEISFRPEVSVEGYEELIPKFSSPRVTQKEIDEKVEEFLQMIAPLSKTNKKILAKDDFAKFDFEGFVDGKPFDGGKAQDYVLQIGSNQFIPGFEDGMIGLRVGEERDVAVKFPQNYGAKNLAGKDAIFKVKLHEIQAKKPAKELGEEELKQALPGEKEPSKEKFEARIKERIKNDKLQKLINEDLKPKFADALAEKFNFALPKAIVEQEINLQFNNAWSGFSKEQIEEFKNNKDALDKKREEFRKAAENSVKLTFLIDELAKKRNIDVSDQELVQAVYMEAYTYGANPKEHLDRYRNNGMLPAVKMALIEEKLFNDIFAKQGKKSGEGKGE